MIPTPTSVDPKSEPKLPISESSYSSPDLSNDDDNLIDESPPPLILCKHSNDYNSDNDVNSVDEGPPPLILCKHFDDYDSDDDDDSDFDISFSKDSGSDSSDDNNTFVTRSTALKDDVIVLFEQPNDKVDACETQVFLMLTTPTEPDDSSLQFIFEDIDKICCKTNQVFWSKTSIFSQPLQF